MGEPAVSIQTTQARAEVRHWETQLKQHRAGCPRCRPARSPDPCHSGLAITGQLAVAKGNLKREVEADKAPIPGQMTLL